MKSNTKIQEVRVRFAPSPTGVLHVGGVRTALYNYLFAKKNNGKLILRIEDTDRERSTKEFENDILEGLKWLSISYDEIYRQSERTAIYKNYLNKLIDTGHAYISKETDAGEGKRSEVIRFRNPNKIITFTDLIRGDITFDTTELGDFVIAKDMETPLYHLAVVVDDIDMSITHIIRGEDGISNTPRQILIQEGLGVVRPHYAHIPFILAPDRSKLSKRHGAVSVTEYRNLGFLPETLVNFLALIGWNPGGEREIYSLDELAKIFSLEKAQKGGAKFDLEKLRWMNKEYLKKMSNEEFKASALKFLPDNIKKQPGYTQKKFETMLTAVSERISTFNDLSTMSEAGDLIYFFKAPEYKKEMLFWKEENDFAKLKLRLTEIIKLLKTIDEKDFTVDNVKKSLWGYATKDGRGLVLWPMRVSLSGKEKSPDPFLLAEILGKEETLYRISQAIKLCDE